MTSDPNAANAVSKSGPLVSLELIRGLASVEVFVHHLTLFSRQAMPSILYRFASWGHMMVLIFFVLSGYVIGLSQQRSPRTAGSFLWARLKRIEPLYLCALGAAAFVFYFFYQQSSTANLFGQLFFLQSWNGLVAGTYPTNSPLWSLGSEMQFYALFALVIWWRKPWARQVWWGLAFLALVLWESGCRFWGPLGLAEETLSFSLLWLLGNFFAGQGPRYALSRRQALFVFSLALFVFQTTWGNDHEYNPLNCLAVASLAAVSMHGLAQAEMKPSNGARGIPWSGLFVFYLAIVSISLLTHCIRLKSSAPYALLPFVVLTLSFWPGWITVWRSPLFRRSALALGRSSYALYVIHHPIICAGTFLYPAGWLRLAMTIAITVWAVIFLEYVVQPRAVRGMERARQLFLFQYWAKPARLGSPLG